MPNAVVCPNPKVKLGLVVALLLPKIEDVAGAPNGVAVAPRPVVFDVVPKPNPPLPPPPKGFEGCATAVAGMPNALLAVLKPNVGGPARPVGLGPCVCPAIIVALAKAMGSGFPVNGDGPSIE